jgi:hypothetical protein
LDVIAFKEEEKRRKRAQSFNYDPMVLSLQQCILIAALLYFFK